MQNLEYIDRFFKDELSPEEVKQFENRIETDPEFAEEVAFYITAMNVAKEEAVAEKRDRFRHIPVNNHHRGTVKKMGSVKSFWAYAAAAAVAILIIGLYLFYPSDQPAQMAERYIQSNLTTLSVNMGAERDSVQAGLSLFNDGEFEKASEAFESVLATNSTSIDALKYAGITALRMGNYEKALNHFMRLEKMQLYSNPGKFYHALTLMKRNNEGDQEQAKVLLQEVIDQDLEGKEHAERWLKDL
jgi:tetratricopeptide (TPR) repeat protein